ncbi:deoxyribonuclease, TatD family [gamma proteobacterium HTCC5015]|nr:deoxyribonuclease, TatD family [gamma proteobacterium HTCC5015]
MDSHCHFDFDVFSHDFDAELARCRAAGVSTIVVPGTTSARWERLQALAERYPMIQPAFGLHPYFIEEHREADLARLATLLQSTRCVAVGECGLDYQLPHYDAKAQQYWLEAQVELAQVAELPLILHARKCHDTLLATLRRRGFQRGGILHAFSGSQQQAYQWIEAGFKLGFGGVLTFERARKIRRLAATLPVESIVLETDAPDMPPAFLARGEVNHPSYLPRIGETLAALRDDSVTALAEQMRQNVQEALRLSLK